MNASTRAYLLALAEDKAAHFGLRPDAIRYPRFLIVRKSHGGADKIWVQDRADYTKSVDHNPKVIEVLNDTPDARLADQLILQYTPKGYSSPRSF